MDTFSLSTHGSTAAVEQDYLAFAMTIDGRARAIIEDRICGSATLAAVAQRFGVTRERIRQVERAAREALASLHSDAYPAFSAAVADLRVELGGFACVSATRDALDHVVREVSPGRRDVILRMLLTLAGPYSERDGWLVTAGATLPTPEQVFGDDTSLDPTQVADTLAALGVEEWQVADWIATWPEVAVVDGTVVRWGRSITDRCAAVLDVRSRAATVEELLAAVPGDFVERSVRWRLIQDPRFVRVSRDRFALAAWDVDAYEGIAATMARILEQEYDGQAPLTTIVDLMVDRFDANPASVRAYADALLFERHDGLLRLRGKRERITVDADATPWALGEDRFALTITVTHDTLRGSGSPCSEGLATGLGVEPGGRRTFAGTDGAVLVSWPMSAFLGPSFGSLRSVVIAAGVAEGDRVTLEFDAAAGTVRARKVATAAA